MRLKELENLSNKWNYGGIKVNFSFDANTQLLVVSVFSDFSKVDFTKVCSSTEEADEWLEKTLR